MEGPFSDLEQWNKDELTGISGGRVDRYKLPAGQKARLSFSGSERNNLFAKIADGHYADVSGISGLDLNSDSRSVGLIDFDRNGLNDVLITNANQQTLNIFENRIAAHDSPKNFVAVRVVGGNTKNRASKKFASRDGVGALIRVTTNSNQMVREVRCGEGLATQNSKTYLFGLDAEEQAKQIQVKWPSGRSTQIESVDCGSVVTFYENPEALKIGSEAVVKSYSEVSRPTNMTAKARTKFPLDLGAQANGGYQIVTAMATWCTSCKKHFPDLNLIAQEWNGEIEVFAVPIDIQDSPEKLNEYVDTFRPEYTLLKPDAVNAKAFVELALRQLGSADLPFTFLVKSGEIVAFYKGFPSISQIRHAIFDDSLE